jgi:precorrin-6B methylase 2
MITPSGIPDFDSSDGSFVGGGWPTPDIVGRLDAALGNGASIVTPIYDAREVAYALGKCVRSLDCQCTVIGSARAIPALRDHVVGTNSKLLVE